MQHSESQKAKLQKLDPRLRGEEKSMKLKVCGMKATQNITELIAVQPDFIGFIFHEQSPRNVLEKPAISIPKEIKKVGVFVNKDNEFIAKKVTDFGLDFVQLHGNESSKFCSELIPPLERGLRGVFKIIKAFNIHENFDFKQLAAYEPYCSYFLFDASGKNAGGNGVTFNWELLNNYKGKTPFLLSGGIDETMVKTIQQINHPQFIGIDINSGFEIAPALKDVDKIKEFKIKI